MYKVEPGLLSSQHTVPLGHTNVESKERCKFFNVDCLVTHGKSRSIQCRLCRGKYVYIVRGEIIGGA